MVWDLPTRVFHWLLVAAVSAAWLTGRNELWDWHGACGATVLGLLLFRVIWGFCGHTPSRFVSFVVGWPVLRAYLGSLWDSVRHRTHAPWFTHNPLGGLSVLALLGILLAQALSGLVSESDVLFAGPLARHLPGWSEPLSAWHRLGAQLIVALVALHLAAVLAHRWLFGETLTSRMWRGHDAVSRAAGLQAPAPRHAAWGGLLLAACLGVSLALLRL